MEDRKELKKRRVLLALLIISLMANVFLIAMPVLCGGDLTGVYECTTSDPDGMCMKMQFNKDNTYCFVLADNTVVESGKYQMDDSKNGVVLCSDRGEITRIRLCDNSVYIANGMDDVSVYEKTKDKDAIPNAENPQ